MRGHGSFRTLTLAACAVLLSAAAVPPPAGKAPAPAPVTAAKPPVAAGTAAPAGATVDGSIVHVLIDTVVVDRGGTRSIAADEADLAPGSPGVLRKEITLTGRDKKRTPEPVILEARLTPEAATAAGTVCSLRVQAETRRRESGARPASSHDAPLDHRQMLVTLGPGEERIVEAYASSMTGGRIALRLRCEPARAEDDGLPDLITLDLEVEKRADEEPTELLRSQRLVAAIGHEASTVIVANQGLPDAPDGGRRYRRERVEALLSPLVLAAGNLQVSVEVKGDITTMSADGTQALLPFDHSESYVMRNGERRSFEIVVPSGSPDAGWTRLTLAVEVTARF